RDGEVSGIVSEAIVIDVRDISHRNDLAVVLECYGLRVGVAPAVEGRGGRPAVAERRVHGPVAVGTTEGEAKDVVAAPALGIIDPERVHELAVPLDGDVRAARKVEATLRALGADGQPSGPEGGVGAAVGVVSRQDVIEPPPRVRSDPQPSNQDLAV